MSSPTEPAPTGAIFICYRRDDSADIAGRIYDRLVAEFGKGAIFRDVDTIPYGVDFRAHIRRCLSTGRIGLVVIGPRWAKMKSPNGKVRLHEPADHVRMEIEAMLARETLLTIPLYVSGARSPSADALPEPLKPLAFLNGPEIRRDPDFHHDMDRLVAQLRRRLAEPLPEPQSSASSPETPQPGSTPGSAPGSAATLAANPTTAQPPIQEDAAAENVPQDPTRLGAPSSRTAVPTPAQLPIQEEVAAKNPTPPETPSSQPTNPTPPQPHTTPPPTDENIPFGEPHPAFAENLRKLAEEEAAAKQRERERKKKILTDWLAIIIGWIFILAIVSGVIALTMQIPKAYRWVSSKITPPTPAPKKIILDDDYKRLVPSPTIRPFKDFAKDLGTPKPATNPNPNPLPTPKPAPRFSDFLVTPRPATPSLGPTLSDILSVVSASPPPAGATTADGEWTIALKTGTRVTYLGRKASQLYIKSAGTLQFIPEETADLKSLRWDKYSATTRAPNAPTPAPPR